MADGGLGGLSLGANYWYTKNSFISAQVGTAINLSLAERLGDTVSWNRISSFFLNIKNNQSIGRFDFGYGLSIADNNWKSIRQVRLKNDYQISTLYNYSNINLGMAFSAYYRLTQYLYTGILYQPYFLSLQNSFMQKYEHTIIFDLMWRFNVKK